jgi:pimeloyl-ACP methyl ester carboxylesterase
MWFAVLSLLACVDLDSFVFSGVPCSTVSEATCEDQSNDWDKVCLSCDEAYDWAKEFEWMDGTLEEGASIRSPDPSAVVREMVPTADGEGELDLYFIPSHGGVSAVANTTVLYNHGNYAGIEHYQPRVHMLYELGFNVLVWDFRGFGKSLPPFSPSVEQFLSDAVLIRDKAEEYAPDPEKILVYSFSLGGIPAVEMAVQRSACALVLEASFTSIAQIISTNSALGMPGSFLSSGGYENQVKIRDYPGPVFGMVGSLDRKFTPETVQEVLDNAPGATELWVLEGVDHGIGSRGVPEAGFEEYKAKLFAFLETHGTDCLDE